MKKNNFIVTESEADRDILLNNGLVLISDTNECFIFLNEPKKLATFNHDELKVVFTNTLTF